MVEGCRKPMAPRSSGGTAAREAERAGAAPAPAQRCAKLRRERRVGRAAAQRQRLLVDDRTEPLKRVERPALVVPHLAREVRVGWGDP